jgi:hypothetical protein
VDLGADSGCGKHGRSHPWQGEAGTIPQRTINSHIRMVFGKLEQDPEGRPFAKCSRDHLLRRMDMIIRLGDEILQLQILRSELESVDSTASIFNIWIYTKVD